MRGTSPEDTAIDLVIEDGSVLWPSLSAYPMVQ
jgi:hypothetical protein